MRRRRTYRTGVGYAALTDIVLLLLIFFLLSTSFVLRPGLRIDLPEGRSEERTEAAPLTVTLTEEGEIFVDGEVVDTIEALDDLFRSYAASRDDPSVILEASRSVFLQHAVRVLDSARQSGLQRLVIATEPPDGTQ